MGVNTLTNSSQIVSDLLYRLNRVRVRQNQVDLSAHAFLFGSGVIAVILIFLLAEIAIDFSSVWRTVLMTLFILSFLGAFTWMILRPFLKWLTIIPSWSDEILAKHIGDSFPNIRDRLLNILQLSKDQQASSELYSSDLIDESLKDIASEIQLFDFMQSVHNSSLRVFRNCLAISVAVTAVLVLLIPESFSGAAYRFIHFTKEFIPLQNYYFECLPGNKEIVKGENVVVRFKVKERIPSLVFKPKEITILHQQEGQENYDEIHVKADSADTFQTAFPLIRTTTKYFSQYLDAESDHFTLTVLDRPFIRSFRLRLAYPPYSKIPPKVMDEFVGDVTALQGTYITLAGIASKSLKEAVLQFGNNVQIPLIIHGDKFSTSFQLQADNSYYFSLIDKEGLANNKPVHYQLKTVMDEYPSITILEPGRNIDITGDQSLNLLLEARDDYGFSSMRIGYRLIKSRYEQAQIEYSFVPVPLPSSNNGDIELPYGWNLTKLNLVPEDVVEYYAEVFDNDVVKGPKSGRSNLFLLRLPSLDEVFADVDKEHEQSLDELKESLGQAKKLKEEIESINRDLKKNKDPDWQTQKKMTEMVQRYQQIQKKLDDVHSRLEQMTQQMQQQNVLSKETMEKYLELQQLFQQLDASELQKALKQMQQQMPNISKEQLQQALQNMTFSEEQFRQSIERTLNLLKRIHIEQKMDEVKKRAQELEKLEKELREESTQSSQTSDQQETLAKKQSDLVNQEQTMEREGTELQQRMEEYFTEMPADKLQKSLEQLKQQQLQQKMQQAARQMQTGNMRSSQQLQQQIEQQLQEFSTQMDEMQQQMLQQQAQYMMNELRKATVNLLELSKDEEALKKQSQSAPQNSPQLRQNAQDQLRAAQDLNNIIKGLEELSQKSFAVTPEMGKALGEALARMNNAMHSLDARNGTQASQDQGQAMTALNRAAKQVQSALQSMMQGGGSGTGSLMQQLQKMAGRQLSLNLQTQQMGGLSQQQAMEAARLAKEQAAIQKSLEELNREAQQSSEQKKLLGDLQKIADEMKEVVQNLEQNNAHPETITKQERILSRLLDASKSVRERDYEKKRKAETGTPIVRRSPKEINFHSIDGRSRLQEELHKALEQGFAKDYQELIRKYFENLELIEPITQ
jgi:hypothetical protein